MTVLSAELEAEVLAEARDRHGPNIVDQGGPGHDDVG